MNRSTFLLITATLSFAFGAMLFFVPSFGSILLGLPTNIETSSVLRGMGGLIIGSAIINFLLRSHTEGATIKALLVTNIITHLLGLSADIWGVYDGALTVIKMVPVEATHLFVGIGSLIYLLNL